jgi:integrase/recombinase XerD
MNVLELYKKELTVDRNCLSSSEIGSERSIKSYCNDVKQFLIFVDQKSVSDISVEDVDAFLRLGAPSSAYRRFASINNFFRFLNESKITDNYPIVKGKTYKKIRKKPERMSVHLTKEETYRFMAEAYKNTKYYAIMMLFLNTGMRISELCDIKRNGYDGKFVRYIAKGNIERIQPVGSVVAEAINKYLDTRTDSIEYLFISSHMKKYNPTTIYKRVETIAHNANIQKKITPHSLRHTCAASMRSAGQDVYAIAKKLGHKNLKTTEIYLKTLVDERDIEIAETSVYNVDFGAISNE